MGVVEPLLPLFSLAGGFAFLQYCRKYRYRWETLEWERNLFEAGLVGAGLFLLTRVAAWFLDSFELMRRAHAALHAVLPFPYVGSFLGAVVLARVLAEVVNSRISEDAAVREAVQNHCGQLLVLLHHAGQHGLPVMLTMANRKVYVGFVMVPPNPNPKHRHTKILPTASGHRHPNTLTIPSFDTHYWPVYEDIRRRRAAGEIVGVKEEDFGIVLPVEQICSANLFDDDTYGRYFQEHPAPQRGDAPDA